MFKTTIWRQSSSRLVPAKLACLFFTRTSLKNVFINIEIQLLCLFMGPWLAQGLRNRRLWEANRCAADNPVTLTATGPMGFCSTGKEKWPSCIMQGPDTHLPPAWCEFPATCRHLKTSAADTSVILEGMKYYNWVTVKAVRDWVWRGAVSISRWPCRALCIGLVKITFLPVF